jgi:hypothetical protein
MPRATEITVPGLYFIQEDSGRQISEAIAAWIDQLAQRQSRVRKADAPA